MTRKYNSLDIKDFLSYVYKRANTTPCQVSIYNTQTEEMKTYNKKGILIATSQLKSKYIMVLDSVKTHEVIHLDSGLLVLIEKGD